MQELIGKNPYRFFGVYSNYRLRELQANENQIRRFCNVGKDINFPLDFNSVLPPLIRKEEDIDIVRNQINLPEDKLRNALFWFIYTPETGKITDLLKEGKPEEAMIILYRDNSLSSLINRGVLSFILGRKEDAIRSILAVVHNFEYRKIFMETICGPYYTISEHELSKLFINELNTIIPFPDLLILFRETGTSAVNERKFIEDIICNQAEKEIQQILSKFNEKDNKTIIDAQTLVIDSGPYLASMRDVLGANNSKYLHLSTNIEGTALKTIIAEVNGAHNQNKPHIKLADGKGIMIKDGGVRINSNNYSKETSLQAWDAIQFLKKMDIHPEANKTLLDNYSILENSLRNMNCKITHNCYFYIESERELFYRCETLQDFNIFIKTFPHGDYVKLARKNIENLKGLVEECNAVSDCIKIIKKFKGSEFEGILDDKCFSFCKTKTDYKKYLTTFTKHTKEVQKHLGLEFYFTKCTNLLLKHAIWSIIFTVTVVLSVILGIIYGVRGCVAFLGFAGLFYLIVDIFSFVFMFTTIGTGKFRGWQRTIFFAVITFLCWGVASYLFCYYCY